MIFYRKVLTGSVNIFYRYGIFLKKFRLIRYLYLTVKRFYSVKLFYKVFLSLGSSASLRASPNRLKARIVINIAIPGDRIHGYCDMADILLAAASIFPQLE